MTEEELIELGFDQITILTTESDNGYDYYFYQKELCDNLILYSTDSIDAKDNNWTLSCYEIPAIRIETALHYEQFLEVLNSIIC
jgi:hypothetical protein